MAIPLNPAAPDAGALILPGPAVSTRRLLLFAGVAGLLAGGLAWGIGEKTLQVFAPKTTTVTMFGTATRKVDFHDQVAADYKNAIAAYSILGASMGLCLGAAGGLARRAIAAGARAGGAGLVLGAVLTGGAAAAVLPVYFHQQEVDQEALSRDLLLPLLVHAGSWAVAGLAGGLALGIGLGTSGAAGRGRPIRTAIGGLVGGILGTIVYELVCGMIFPTDKIGEPISRTAATRAVARLAVALLAGSMAALTAENKPRPSKTTTTPASPQAAPSEA